MFREAGGIGANRHWIQEVYGNAQYMYESQL